MRQKRKNSEKSSLNEQATDTAVESASEAPISASEPIESEETADASPSGAADDQKDNLNGDTQVMVFSCPVDHQGGTVHVKGWVKSSSTRPPIIFVHDLGEHIGLYRPAARGLVAAGYSVYGFDLRGHGLSGPSLGHIPNFSTLVNDLLQVVAWVRFKSMRRVPIIIGQGIGALIAVYFQIAYPNLCLGTVLVAPYLNVNVRTSFHKRFIIRTLADMAPKMRLPSAFVPTFMSHFTTGRGPATLLASKPFHGITANFANELLNAMNRVPEDFSKFDCPSLILCPQRSSVCDYEHLKGLIASHPGHDYLAIEKLLDAGHHVLTEEESILDLALRHMIPWLDNMGVTPV